MAPNLETLAYHVLYTIHHIPCVLYHIYIYMYTMYHIRALWLWGQVVVEHAGDFPSPPAMPPKEVEAPPVAAAWGAGGSS